jgi:SAM-dependent methyltransferase
LPGGRLKLDAKLEIYPVSKRPIVRVSQTTYSLWNFTRRVVKFRKWRIEKDQRGLYFVSADDKDLVQLPPKYFSEVFNHWFDDWEKNYLPPSGVGGETVLDVGSGAGETAYFYLQKGARKVICVEKDEIALESLRRNVRYNRWPVEIKEGEFKLSDLWRDSFQFAKFDCEGCEEFLLDLEELPPCVIETHSVRVLHKLCDKFYPLTILRTSRRYSGLALVTNTR